MKTNTLKLFMRLLKREKMFSIITIGGYAISMAVLLILLAFIFGEYNVNSDFKNGKNIYRITRSDNRSDVPQTLLTDVKENIPGIDKMCLYTIHQRLYKIGNHQESAYFIGTNDDFLQMFSFEFIYQSSDPTLAIEDNIILTKTFSEKLFGERNPVGEFFQIGGKQFNIVGIVSDVPQNASFSFDALINFKFVYLSKSGYNKEDHIMHNSFVSIKPNADFEAVNSQISGMINHWGLFKKVKLSLQPLSQVYFKGYRSDNLEHANVNLIYLLSSISLLVLLMTIFNYVNLTVARGLERLNEIGIRKASGAWKKDIFFQVISESVIVSLSSMLIAVIVASLIFPFFSRIIGVDIEFKALFSKANVLMGITMVFLLTGILSGIYPAMKFSGVSPLQMMSYHKGIKRKGKSAGIIAVQFMITSVLILCLLFIQKQLDYIKYKDFGFDKEMMVRLDLKGNLSRKHEIIKNELIKYPQFISVSASCGSPMQMVGSSSGKFTINGKEKEMSTKSFSIDEDFIDAFNIEIVEGRNFVPTDNDEIIINEQLYKTLEWDNLSGQKYLGRSVVGVVKDFHYENLYNGIGNLEIQKVDRIASILNIKIKGDISKNLELIKDIYTKIEPEVPFTFKFYDDCLYKMYQKEEKAAKAIQIFAIIAIIISCLGLIGLIEHITRVKVKEISIRKINGAKTREIISMLNISIVKWVFLGFIIACPLVYYIMNRWLENFAYKTSLNWWIFALAGLLALAIALLTVSFQSWKAATRNPVEALRYE